MIIQGKISRIINADTEAIVEITIPVYQGVWLEELDREKLYAFNVKEAVGKKSANQNNTAWLLMNDIAKKEDVMPDPEAVYIQLLKMSKIKTNYLQVLNDPKVLETLSRSFRVVKVLEVGKNTKGNEIATVEVAEGMSRFNKEEMATFIDKLLYYAERVGIDTDKYRFT